MQINITKTTILLTIFFLFGLPFFAAAQSAESFTLTAEDLQNGKTIELDKAGWRFHAGDDLNWANPEFDDSAWERLDDSALAVDKLAGTDWRGIGWFRLRVQIPSDLAGEQLALQMQQWGASEIYLDGRLLRRFGTVGTNADNEVADNPHGVSIGVNFETSGEHIIAVRHSVMNYQNPNSVISRWLSKQEVTFLGIVTGAGFKLLLASPDTLRETQSALILNYFSSIRAGLIFTVGLLFLLLYYYYPRQKAALFFGIFALSKFLEFSTAFLYTDVLTDLRLATFANTLNNLCWIGYNISLPLFLYTTFYGFIPKYYRIILLTSLLALVLITFLPDWSVGLKLLGLVLAFVSIESLRLTAAALRQKKDGALILFIGAMTFAPLSIYWSLQNLGIVTLPESILFVVRQIASYGIVIAISIYLARQFAQTNSHLEAQLIKEVEHERDKARFMIVEAENERRAKELEEARQLQLSMLPKKLPVITNLEIAAYMKPATEVGGDYYDFHEGADGTLTVAVGDATGHGLKAGSVVTATKSLFNAFAEQSNIPQIFGQTSGALKKMNLRGLFMAMTMLKIKDGAMNICVAGMPSVLICRSLTGKVEEVAIRAMPLGSIAKTNYQEKEFTLEVGDVVLIMSDGFPEMFNAENEMLGFGKAAEVLPDIAANSAQEIINHLVKVGEDWANGRAQDDDVTFVVLKVKTEDDGNF